MTAEALALVQAELGAVAQDLGAIAERLRVAEEAAGFFDEPASLAYVTVTSASAARQAAEEHARALASVATLTPDAAQARKRSAAQRQHPGHLVVGAAEAALMRGAADHLRELQAAVRESPRPDLVDAALGKVIELLEVTAESAAGAGNPALDPMPAPKDSDAGGEPS